METDPFAMNVAGATDLVASDTNKIDQSDQLLVEGVEGEKVDALSLDLDDEDLLRLARHWNAEYAPYKARIAKKQEANRQYYIGKQWEGTQYSTNFPIEANILFEAEETFLPAALSKNPEPVVFADDTQEGNKVSDDVKTMLQYHADYLNLRTKLQMLCRQWSIYHLGVLKIGWDAKLNDVKLELRKIQDFVFDCEGSVDPIGHFDSYLGEQITVTAERLIDLYPDSKSYIKEMVTDDEGRVRLGTKVTYTEWWTDEFYFVTFKDKILDKGKNPFFKYEDEETEPRNHFAQPKKPYIFLSVFSLGEQPHDITGLIEQNIPQQNLITKRTRQIDKNLSLQNNATAYSAENFNQETAKQANQAMEDGNGILVPEGRPLAEAIMRLPAEGFPDSAYKELQMSMDNLRSIFGVQGITAQQPDEDTTARGMILNQQYDNSRIGGGIGEAIERVAKGTFNWLVQIYHVYYDEKHFAAVMGELKAVEYVVLSAEDLARRLIVTVSPDSMKPKDEITLANQAMELWGQKAIDPKTLLTMLKFPDPQETAENAVLWNTNPQLYMQLMFPDLLAKIQEAQGMGQMAPPMGGQGGVQPEAPAQPGTAAGGGIESNASLSQVPLPK